MRGSDQVTGSLFSYVDLEERIPVRHPLRKIRAVVNDALRSLDAEFDRLYAGEGRPSIAPERLIRASLLHILYSIRSERQLMEQMDYNLLFRWFVGLGIDDVVWVPTVFTRLCCTNRVRDSSRESSMVAVMHEQTYTPNLQDQELASL
ncbi:ISMca1, transposase [Salipiger bermudensis HTCC2601]|uniref:ISMca1, transposase n=1 Tax=Salipiger bermudensis (strain DSM 26914 / JCM 13377 / KCTC 12554 / HTCC2601) TaxID=314265 RepID=Q0FJ30_SALBH|nr:ISMca1, transposase [Salipiger bermudensis HTCC2601]